MFHLLYIYLDFYPIYLDFYPQLEDDKYQEIELSVYGPPLFNSAGVQRPTIGQDFTVICSIAGRPGISAVVSIFLLLIPTLSC